jgi:hypothetical protein
MSRIIFNFPCGGENLAVTVGVTGDPSRRKHVAGLIEIVGAFLANVRVPVSPTECHSAVSPTECHSDSGMRLDTGTASSVCISLAR